MRFSFWLAIALAGWVGSPSAHAHFPWLVPDAADNRVRLYFGETAAPDDPALLDRFAEARLFAREGRDKFVEHGLVKQDAALAAPLGAGRVVGLSHVYGVLKRGDARFLLRYHAAAHVAPLPGEWKAVGDAERLPLEIAPRQIGGQIELTVRWRGEPLAGAEVSASVVGAKPAEANGEASGEKQAEPASNVFRGVTDERGRFTFAPRGSGLVAARAKHVEPTAGKLKDEPYDTIRHWTTLTFPASAPVMESIAAELPELPRGVTSFGAAIVNNAVYVYGGNWSDSHHYFTEGQSNELLRLDLAAPRRWETLAAGPRRTGVALVARDGKLIRVGGFEARNREADAADLRSTADVARFDPATNRWEDLPPLPTSRSSHDAIVLGDTLYACGGWNLQSPAEGVFHDTLVALDLSAKELAWKSIPAPFKRRALSVATHHGKLYVIGGMQEKGGPATTVDVYDPATQSWSSAPALHGAPMEGFGTTAFEIDGRLTVLSQSGAVQQLAPDGQRWIVAGQLRHPRFFARLLPLTEGRAVVVGGGDMSSGKVTKLEVLAPTARAN